MDPNAPPATSRFTVQLVVVFLGLYMLATLTAVTTLILHGTPTAQIALVASGGTTALGALAMVLSSTRVANPIPAKEVAALPPVPPPAVTTTTTTEVHAPDAVVTGPATDTEVLDPDA